MTAGSFMVEVIERNERGLGAALVSRAARRQAILPKAFADRFVPLNPSDESASEHMQLLSDQSKWPNKKLSAKWL